MATSNGRSKQDKPGGESDTLNMIFDATDPQEGRALQAAQLYATWRGKRKVVVVAFLEAAWLVYERTGELPTPTQIQNAILTLVEGKR